MISKILQKFKNISKKKFLFKIPKKKQIIVVHNDGIETFFYNFFKKDDVEIVDPNFEINIYVWAITFHRCIFEKNPWFPYIEKYIEIVDPKIVITRICNDLQFYRLKERDNSNRIYISVQNGINAGNHVLQKKFVHKKFKNKLSADYIFCFGNNDIETFNSIIKSKVIPSGSIINNYVKKNNEKTTKKILYISTFRYRATKYFTGLSEYGEPILYSKYFELDKIILEYLKKFCLQNKYELQICGSRADQKLIEIEKKLWVNLIGSSGWNYLPKTTTTSNYEEIDKSEIVVFVESCLGYEALARGKKTAAFSCRGEFLKIQNYNFGLFNKNIPAKGSFWTSESTEEEFSRIMNYLTSINQAQWENELNKYMPDLMLFDPGNIKFKSIIDRHKSY